MTSKERNKSRARRSKHTQCLKHSFKKVFVSHAQLAHFSTLAKEKHMLLILNFSTLTFITNARTTMPFARLHSQMVCTQSEPAEILQHMFVQILVQVGGDRKRRTSRTTQISHTTCDASLLSCLLREDMKNQLPSKPSNVWNANRKWTLAWEPMWLSAFSVRKLHNFAVHWTHSRLEQTSKNYQKKQDANLPSAHDVESHCWNQACY